MSDWPTRIALTVVLSLTACSSVPIHYYTLVPRGILALQTSANSPPLVDVRIARVPPQVNRSELVVRSGANELAILENQRWAAPLRDELRDAIRLALQSDLKDSAVLPGTVKLEVIVSVDRLDAELNRAVVLDATWTVVAAGVATADLPSGNCAVHTEKTIGAGYEAMVDGYQAAVQALSQAIASALNSHTCRN